MDCTDIVIGTARGGFSRIGDYYTRDRSTPRFDSFYGGQDSLTAAVGEERDGMTTILFRRKLKSKFNIYYVFLACFFLNIICMKR